MQTHEIDAGPRAPAGLSVSRAIASTRAKPLQLIPREPIPQAQRRERNHLRPVRIETEQPRPDQAI
jgi:hypothetical protein